MTHTGSENCNAQILEREFSALTVAGAELLDAVQMKGAADSVARLFFRFGTS